MLSFSVGWRSPLGMLPAQLLSALSSEARRQPPRLGLNDLSRKAPEFRGASVDGGLPCMLLHGWRRICKGFIRPSPPTMGMAKDELLIEERGKTRRISFVLPSGNGAIFAAKLFHPRVSHHF